MVITVDYTGTGTWARSRPQHVDVFHYCHFWWAALKRFQQVDAAPVTKGACLTRTVWQLASASLLLVIVIWRVCQPCHAGTEEEASHPELVSEPVCGPPAVVLETNWGFHLWLGLFYWLLSDTGPQSLWNGGDPGCQKHDRSFLGSTFMTEFL